MDFGLVGMDGLDSMASEAETSEQGSGSGLVKEKRSGLVEDDWMNLKMARTDDFGASKAMQPKGPLFRSNSLFLDGEQQQQQQLLISFSTPKSGALLASNNGLEKSFQSPILNYPHSSTLHARDAGLGSGSSIGSMHGGVLVGIGGSFTPSQRLEFENQALIYKYIAANVPVPHNLLMSIKRGLNPTGFSGFSSGSLGPNTAGLGPFHLSLQQHRSGAREDPEPGRCRRTDGKKWRCSRDAVADQKYCERHMRRGRHRSRKPVEGQIGHAVSSTATVNGMPLNPSSAMVVSGGSTSNGLAIAHQQLNNLRSATNTSRMHINGISLNKLNVGSQMLDLQSLLMPSSINLNAKNGYPTLKQQFPFEGSSQTQFGLISPDSFLNPQSNTHTVSRNVYLSPDPSDQDSLESQSHPLRHFIDDWPKHQSGCPDITWPNVEEIQTDRTRLSISMPVASSDFSSSNSSSTQEQLTLSPLKSSCELDPVEMGLGVGSFLNESTQRQANWIPASLEASMGGPLSEVLKSTIVNPSDSKNTVLDLMTEGWDASSQLDESPTGVLQKTTFGSLSSSSSGSSPIAERKIHDQISLCDNFHGSCSALIDATIPST